MTTDIRDTQKVQTLPSDLKEIANAMLQEKFGLTSMGEVVEQTPKASMESKSTQMDIQSSIRDDYHAYEGHPKSYSSIEVWMEFILEGFLEKYHDLSNSIQILGKDTIAVRMSGGRTNQTYEMWFTANAFMGMRVSQAVRYIEERLRMFEYEVGESLRPYGCGNSIGQFYYSGR